MSAAAAQGTWVGDLLGKTTWLLAGNEGKVPATTTVVEAEAGSWPNVPTLGSSPQSGANPLAVYGQNTSKMVHLFENPAHSLEPIVAKFGSPEQALEAVHEAAQQFVGKPGAIVTTWMDVGGTPVWVRGTTVDGVFRIGTLSGDVNNSKYPYP